MRNSAAADSLGGEGCGAVLCGGLGVIKMGEWGLLVD